MSLRSYAIVHYHEVGLKGGNRSFFERALVRNLEKALGDHIAGPVKRLPGRLLVPLPNDHDRAAIESRLADVYGIANFSIADGDRMSLEQICDVALDQANKSDYETFAVRARKAHSEFE